MENSYGIRITNRYSCFLNSDDDDDDTEEIRPQEEEKKKKETGSTTTAGNEAVETVSRTNNAAGDAGNKPNRNRIPRNGRSERVRVVRFTEEDREERNNRWNREDSSQKIRSSDSHYSSGRWGFRVDRRGGPRGGRGYSARGFWKREFDRQSESKKSGIKPVEKQEGAGSGNWGTYKDDLEGTNAIKRGYQSGRNERSEDKPKGTERTNDHETGDEQENQMDTTIAHTQEQLKLMTLDEWKALQQTRQKPVFNLRKPGEGEHPCQMQKMILIKNKKKEEEEGEEKEEEYECPQRAGRQKQVLEIGFHFTESHRGGNERCGGPSRGDSPGTGGDSKRGFRGGRGGRNDRPRQSAPKVDDMNDFPSLMG